MKCLQYFLTCTIAVMAISVSAQVDLSVGELRCESKVNPVAVSEISPRFSWVVHCSARNTTQSSFHLLVSDTPENLQGETGNCWDTKVITSDQSVLVPYRGKKLESGKKYYWRVRITDQAGHQSRWSEISWFRMGLLNSGDWGDARWISYENLPDSMKIVPGIHGSGDKLGIRGVKRSVVPLFRKEFSVPGKITRATLYICGLGQYEAFLNGERVGESILSPGWTDYDKTCLYNTYDVTGKMRPDKNVLGVLVGNGFYNINRERYRKLVIAYGYPKLLTKLRLDYSDGSSSMVCSGPDWKCIPSPVEYSSIYGGEDYNALVEQKGWDQPGFDDSAWKQVLLAEAPAGRLTPEADFPVTINQLIPAKKISEIKPDRYLYDFGQNASGILELKVSGKRGKVIKITPGELITKELEINQKASGAPYYYTYTVKGDGVEVWRPKFTYYGFRYAMVEGAVPDSLKNGSNLPHVISLTMLHTCNSSPRNGAFSCSNQLFNRVYTLIDWAIRSNLQSVVTDCPHREKLGWLEQTYLMGASLHYNYDLYSLYKKAVKDMMDAQLTNGLVPDIAPEYTPFQGGFRDSPEWGSAAVILPWMLWAWYGDRSIVEEALPMMKKYVDYLGTRATGNLLNHGLGDWFDYGPKSPGEAQLTPKSLTATAIYYYDIQLLAKMLRVCDKVSEAQELEVLADHVKRSFNMKFFDKETKIYSTGSQTAISMPLCVGLVDERDRDAVVKNLVRTIGNSGNALTAGDVGFHFLVKALEEGGASGLLYKMNTRDDVPGYGFQLKKGATALTESWPALEEVSNNHLMLGHLMEWFYTGLGGIGQEFGGAAFKQIVIRPQLAGDLTWVNSSYNSPYGLITSNWKREGKVLTMVVEIPSNAEGRIIFPINRETAITENGRSVAVTKSAEGSYSCKVGSGKYHFSLEPE